MTTDTSTDPLSSVPQLMHHQTLRSPALNTRTWSSQSHPDPRTPLLATATSDKSVHIWDMRTWKLLSTIGGGHKRSVRCVGWKDYGRHRQKKKRRVENSNEEEEEGKGAKKDPVLLATGSFDANAGLWVWNRDNDDGGEGRKDVAVSQRLPGAFEDEDAEQERDFTHTGGDEENEDWHFSTLLTGPDSEIKDVKFSPAHYGATLLATCSRDKSVWVWEEVEPEEWETIAVLSEHTGDVKCLAWCEAGRTSRRALKKRLEQRRKATSGVTGEEQSAMDVDATNGGATAGDDDDEEIIVGGRELLASGSYDDTIRLYHDDESEGDWICIAVLTGHDGTVWDLKFEPYIDLSSYTTSTTAEEIIADWTPRILSCSDDLSIRVWRKVLKEKERIERRSRIEAARQGQTGGHDSGTRQRQTGFVGQMPSVIRVGNSTEQWIEETRLPAVHMRSVYAIDWSSRTGLVVSCGGDGLIAVYREVPAANNGGPGIPGPEKDAPMSNDGTTQDGAQEEQEVLPKHKTEWKVVAAVEAAHDEYEINHVCWAPRRDARQRQLEGGKAVVDGGDEGGQEDEEEEEYVVSTGDDGDVRVWRMPEEVLRMVRDEVYE